MPDFDAATLPLDRNQLIEASAGTGKTYTITNLCLRLLLGRDQAPLAINQILILTFTIAATDELKHRVAKRIREARQAFRVGHGDDFLMHLINESHDTVRDQKLLAAASQLMDEASIFTIHGFCARVLGEQAFESGVLFNQDLNADRDEILQTSAEDYFRTDILSLDTNLRAMALSIWRNPTLLAGSLKPYLFRGELHRYPENIEHFDAKALIETALTAKAHWVQQDMQGLLKAANLHARRKPMLRLDQMNVFCNSPAADLDNELWNIYSAAGLSSSMTSKTVMPENPVLGMINEVARSVEGLKAHIWQHAMQGVAARIQSEKDDWSRMTLDDLLSRTAEAVTRSGSNLSETIANRWPIAMIDEFQDTDSTQNDIFSTVYNGEKTLLMIGDPKQAIYNFRGADVFTYINARRATPDIHSLGVNWRSSPLMIEATNHLFNHPNVFGNDADMPFDPVKSAPSNQTMAATSQGIRCAPYHLFVTGQPDDFSTVPDALVQTMDYAAEETVRLISEASDIRLDDKTIEAGQVAFLVRNRRDARAAQEALGRRNIKSVYLTMDSVFLQDTAHDLKLILEAALEPNSDRAIRAALATRLLQSRALDIDALNHDSALHQSVIAEFQDYHETWRDKDIAPMLNKLMQRRKLAELWLNQPEGERQLTNLRHLAEVLQHQSMTSPGMFQLIKWFAQEQNKAETATSEERQLRLESDENLVKIVTMHAAKGLEYDIVMIPMPVFSERRSSGPVLFHEERDGNFVTALELGKNEAHRQLSKAEDEAEEMRLLYVALTRARYRCYLGVPKLKTWARSRIASLIGAVDVKKATDLHSVVAELLPEHLFEVVEANHATSTSYQPAANQEDLITPAPRPFMPVSWRIHSYTGVAARLSEDREVIPVAGFQDDDPHEAANTIDPGLSRFTFPRGPAVGVALHTMMEDMEFTDNSGHREISERTLSRLALDTSWLDMLVDWQKDIIHTPMAPCSLKDIGRVDRLDEMEFHFPLDASAELVSFLLDTGYLKHTEVEKLHLQGFMTGLIDLTFRFDEQYYIVDYKSNHLGNRTDDYSSQRLQQAMEHHNYSLQYLIYTIAIHRMLKQRLAEYEYETHFGGVRYLFLRGMDGRTDQGVFSARPDKAVVLRMDELLGGAS